MTPVRSISSTKYQFTAGAVGVLDLQATIVHLLGIDQLQLKFKYQGRRYRLTDLPGHAVHDNRSRFGAGRSNAGTQVHVNNRLTSRGEVG